VGIEQQLTFTENARALPPRLPALTGLRALVALHVFAFHFLPWAWRGVHPLAAGLVHAGYAAVSALFVLSGFVLAVNHPEPLGAEARARFFASRVARLYPSYLAAFLLYLPIAAEEWFGRAAPPLALPPAAGFALVAILTLGVAQAWLPWTARLWNAPGWATSAIFAAYAIFPPLVARLARARGAALLRAAAALWLLGLLPAILYLAVAPGGAAASPGTQGALVDLLKHHPVARVGEFASGVALGLWWVRGGRRVAIPSWAAPAAALAALAFATLSPPLLPYALVHNGLLTPLFAVLLVGLAAGRGVLARALAWRPVVALGEAGFTIYVFQWPAWFVAERIALRHGVDTLSGPWFLGCGAALVAFSVLWTRRFERPARRAMLAGIERLRRAEPLRTLVDAPDRG
jgi:peptidoglycan/LPS O-acetylase OafA/YrhL